MGLVSAEYGPRRSQMLTQAIACGNEVCRAGFSPLTRWRGCATTE